MAKKSAEYIEVQKVRDANHAGWECMETLDNSATVYIKEDKRGFHAKIYEGLSIKPKHILQAGSERLRTSEIKLLVEKIKAANDK